MTSTGGLILCGGKSSRMGYDKAALRLGGETVLERVCSRIGQVAAPVVVSLGQGAAAPVLPATVELVRDSEPDRGPLWGLVEGFRRLAGRVDQVLVTPVDMPFFTPDWMERLVAGVEGHRACLYQWEGIVNALTGVYRLELLPKLEGLIAEGKARPIFLREGEPTRILELETLWRPGQGPSPLMDMDTPEEYRRTLWMEGFGSEEGQPITVEVPLAEQERPEEIPLAVRTVGEALEAVLRLFPEKKPRSEAGGSPNSPGFDGFSLVAVRDQGERAPLAPSDPVRAGDRLRLE